MNKKQIQEYVQDSTAVCGLIEFDPRAFVVGVYLGYITLGPFGFIFEDWPLIYSSWRSRYVTVYLVKGLGLGFDYEHRQVTITLGPLDIEFSW